MAPAPSLSPPAKAGRGPAGFRTPPAPTAPRWTPPPSRSIPKVPTFNPAKSSLPQTAANSAARAARRAAARKAATAAGTRAIARKAGLRAAGAAAFRGAARFAPLIGWALLAYDAVQLGIWAKNYFDEARRRGDSKRYPDDVGPPEFEGGQDDAWYVTGGTTTTDNAGTNPWNGQIWGPIGGFRLHDYIKFNRPHKKVQAYGRRVIGGNPVGDVGWWDQSGGQYNGSLGATPRNLTVNTPSKVGGAPEVNPSLPGPSTPNPIYGSPSTVPPPELPFSLPSPVPKFDVPSLPDIADFSPTAPKNNPGILPNFDPNLDPDGNPQPKIGPGTTTTPAPKPQPKYDTPRKSKPSTKSCNPVDNPCTSALGDFLEYLDDKQDRQREEDKTEEGEPPVSEIINFPWVQCTEEGPVIQMGTIILISSNPPDLLDVLTTQANLALKGCETNDSIVAVPDAWVPRRFVSPPTLVLVFRKLGSNTYHSYSIPHPANTSPPANPPLGAFQKGNTIGFLRLFDNTKFTVNALNEDEASRVLGEVQALISPSVLSQGTEIRYTQRLGFPVGEAEMRPVRAMFFATGQKDLMPDWRVSF